jgi:hypothetical protein
MTELRQDAEPTEEGKKRWPPEGRYYGSWIGEEGYEYFAPCTCTPECPMSSHRHTECKGSCGCAACWLAEFG